VLRIQDFSTGTRLQTAGARQPDGGGVADTGRGVDPTVRIRRRNRCKICGRLLPEARVFCSYCVHYVH
jgi:hypothetical protein